MTRMIFGADTTRNLDPSINLKCEYEHKLDFIYKIGIKQMDVINLIAAHLSKY